MIGNRNGLYKAPNLLMKSKTLQNRGVFLEENPRGDRAVKRLRLNSEHPEPILYKFL